MNNFDCIIIGSGIAGITAAIYLKRADKNVLLLESNIPGGQINKTSNVENYPGFTKIDGPSLASNLLDQVEHLNINLKYEEVISVEKEDNFKITTKKDTYNAPYVILATGRTPNLLGLENEKELIGKGISFCALCDGNFYKGLDVVVVGGGDSAFEESLYLSNICKSVTIINRSDKLRASNILQDQVSKRDNIKIIYNESITKINTENDRIVSVNLKDSILSCSGIFVYIGSTPNLNYLKDINIEVENNYVVVDKTMKTNIEGLYAAGDVIKKNTYQIVTAASDGAKAASSVIKNME